MSTAVKVLLWGVGGLFGLACLWMVFLFVMAGLAMAKNSDSMEREAAAREAAWKAMTPAQHLDEARRLLEQEDIPELALRHLEAVPEGTPGRAELFATASREKKANDEVRAREEAEVAKRRATMEAISPSQHLALARAALKEGDVNRCRDHLLYLPPGSPGFREISDGLWRLTKAQEAQQAKTSAPAPDPAAK